MSPLKTLPLVAALAVLAACSGGKTEQAAAPPPAAQTPPQKTVLDDQLKAIDKAKGVQSTVDDEDARRRKAIDEQEH